MSKIPCGGFELDDSLVVNDGKLGLAPGIGGGEVARIQAGNGFNGQLGWLENDEIPFDGADMTFAEADELYEKWITGSIRILAKITSGLKSGSGDTWMEITSVVKNANDSSGNTYSISFSGRAGDITYEATIFPQ